MQEVIKLINSLSPSEKQQFKRKHKPDSDFILLFDFINKYKSCDNSKAIKYITKKRQENKSLNSSYLSVLKTYLRDRIMESLRLQYIHKRKNYELLSRSMNTDILIEKGLYALARNELEAALKNQEDKSFPIERLLLLRRKSILSYYENYILTSLDDIENLYEERTESAEQLLLEIKFARILSLLSHQHFSGKKDKKQLLSFMEEHYMKDESLSKEFTTQYLFNWVHAQFEEFNNNPEGAFNYFRKSVNLWLTNPQYIDMNPRMYLGTCSTFFKYLIHQENPLSNTILEINYDTLFSKLKESSLNTDEKTTYRYLFLIAEILSLRKINQYKRIVKLYKSNISQPDFLAKIPSYEKVILTYYAALSCFKIKDFEATINILHHKVINDQNELSKNLKLVSPCIMLYLSALLETKQHMYLKTQISKLKGDLLKFNCLGFFEQEFLKMLSQAISPRFQDNIIQVYSRFYKRLDSLKMASEHLDNPEYVFFKDFVKNKTNVLDRDQQ